MFDDVTLHVDGEPVRVPVVSAVRAEDCDGPDRAAYLLGLADGRVVMVYVSDYFPGVIVDHGVIVSAE